MGLLNAIPISDLQSIDFPMELPLNYHDRTMHHLPSGMNPLQKRILELDEFCKIQQFVINEKKTKTVIFNTATSRDFTPRLFNVQGTVYDNVDSFKLLGVDFTTDHKRGINFDTYLKNCVKKGYNNLWIIRRLAELGVGIEAILLAYTSRVRVFVEMNVPLWHFSLTKKMNKHIEKLQRVAVFIILGTHSDKDYYCNLAMLELDTLEERRQEMIKNFAIKTLKHPVHRNLFKFSACNSSRSGRKVIVPSTRTQRYERSSIPSLSKYINLHLSDNS